MTPPTPESFDVAGLRRRMEEQREAWPSLTTNAVLRPEMDAILAALEERERTMPLVEGLLRLIDLLEASAKLRDGSGYGHASVTAVVNVLRQADAVRAALAAREAKEVRDRAE